jgi:hypothetical protein
VPSDSFTCYDEVVKASLSYKGLLFLEFAADVLAQPRRPFNSLLACYSTALLSLVSNSIKPIQ